MDEGIKNSLGRVGIGICKDLTFVGRAKVGEFKVWKVRWEIHLWKEVDLSLFKVIRDVQMIKGID